MRGTPDGSLAQRYEAVPCNGIGNDNPTGEWVVHNATTVADGVLYKEDGSIEDVDYKDATRFATKQAAEGAADDLNSRLKKFEDLYEPVL